MELPNYRLPGLKNVAQLLWEKARDFLERAFTVIFLATIIIWFLQNFDFQLSLTADPQESILPGSPAASRRCLHRWALATGGCPRR